MILINNYQKQDNRIILIKHEINLGKIKSRTDGIKIATGKYITVLDGDDAFIHKDILLHSLYIANLGDLDIVEFKMIAYKRGKYRIWHNRYHIKTNEIVYQPKLRTKFFLLSEDHRIYPVQNRNLCGKIIKNIILKKIINNIGAKYTEDYILNYEDTIMAVSLFQIAKSYYYMKENGYYYSKDDKKKIKFNNIDHDLQFRRSSSLKIEGEENENSKNGNEHHINIKDLNKRFFIHKQPKTPNERKNFNNLVSKENNLNKNNNLFFNNIIPSPILNNNKKTNNNNNYYLLKKIIIFITIFN